MDVTIQLRKPINLPNCLRQAGFHPIPGSWVRPLSGARYPRLHLYVEQANPTNCKLSLHIDQKQTTLDMPGLKRHAGEYRSPVVMQEMERIQRWIEYAQRT